MGRTWDAVGGLLLGAVCAGCGGAGPPLCDACADELAGPPHPTAPTPVPTGFPRTWTTAAYAGAVRATLLAHKEEGRLSLARPLGRALAEAVTAAVAAPGGRPRLGPVVLVPVPSSRRAVRARGHDPLLRVSRYAATALRARGRATTVAGVLRQRRRVADSAGLDAAARRRNLAGSLTVPPPLRVLLVQGRVVVVDDVVTTGATLAEAARALAAAGCADVVAATIAATQRRAR